jgi:hypothetical protein
LLVSSPQARKEKHVASVWAALEGWRLEELEAAELQLEAGVQRRRQHAVPRWLRPAAAWLAQHIYSPLAA